MKKKKINFYKLAVYVVLIMAAIGFTLPGFLEFGDQQQPTEPRICQSDSECYLDCEEPLPVLCYHNLCQQNSCLEQTEYPYQNQAQLTAQLDITIVGEKLPLPERSVESNFFVTFTSNSFTSFSSELYLNHVLDKLNIKLDQSCLIIDQISYCRDNQHSLQLIIDGEESYSYESYQPQDKDKISIIYT